MTTKAGIVEALGQNRLLLPSLIEQALAANERGKYLLALLQNARVQADAPTTAVSDLRRERLAAGIDDVSLDRVVARAERLSADCYRIPGVDRLAAEVSETVKVMIAPLTDAEADPFRQRLAALAPPPLADEVITGALIDAMTAGDRAAGDSLHLLIMEVHRAINRLQASIATESIDGACTYGLGEANRALVRAFMAGLNRTAPLAFGHPGLATTATESAGRLMMQNDLGTTDAHVVVITVAGRTATVTYTDIHLERLAFFQSQFAGFAVEWSGVQRQNAEALAAGRYAITVGTLTAPTTADLARFLEHLGSRLVFVIDWNRARKRLRSFVGNSEAVRLLTWAATRDLGHRAFLVLGGEKAIYEAMEFASAGRFRLGDRLMDVLGPERTSEFLEFVIETASRGLLAGRSPALIKDEIKVALHGHLQTPSERLLAIAARHGAYTQAIAAALHRFLVCHSGDTREVAQLARRAAAWESAADRLLNDARAEARRSQHAATLLQCFDRSDDAADRLEDAAFLLTLMDAHGCGARIVAAVAGLAELLDSDTRAFVSVLYAAEQWARSGSADDLDDVLSGIERIVAIEHEADAKLRAVTTTVISEAAGFRDLFLATRFAETLESASDCLAHAAQVLRGYLLDEVHRA